MTGSDRDWELVDERPQARVSPGAMLRAARERAGWSEERMAAELRLPVARLQALELDDYSSFGPPVFVRGYLRRCATLLGIPAVDVVAAYETTAGTTGRLEDIVALPPGRIPRPLPGWTGPLLSIAALAAVVTAGWWAFALVTAERPVQVATAPRDLPAAGSAGSLALEVPAARGGGQARTEPAGATPEVALPAPPAEESPRAPRTVAESLSESAAIETVQRPVERSAPSAERPAAATPGTVELTLEFNEDCWLEVVDARDRRLAYRLAKAGEVARIQGTAPLSVFLGNADGVNLAVDGEPLAVRPAARRDGTARLTVGGGAG